MGEPLGDSGGLLNEQFGEYLLQRRIGQGGMAITFVAKEKISNIGERLVAIKQILPEFSADPKFRQMFHDEVRVSSLLNHQNICRIYRAGEINGQLFMAMEFVDGLSLADLWRVVGSRGEPFPIVHALYLMSEVLEGLHSAHTQVDTEGVPLNLVHRDVSPQNILISRKGEVKIIDFGVAKAASNMSQTRTGAIKGKVLYLSPEQLQAKVLDARSDIYSAGLVLYEMLTGEHPFRGPDEHATIFNYCTKEVVAPSRVASYFPSHLDGLVMSALTRDREGRYPSAAAMARTLSDGLYALVPNYRAYHFKDFIEWALSSGSVGPMPQIATSNPDLVTGPGVVSASGLGHTMPASIPPLISSPSAATGESPASPRVVPHQTTNKLGVESRNTTLWIALGVMVVMIVGAVIAAVVIFTSTEKPALDSAKEDSPAESEEATAPAAGWGDGAAAGGSGQKTAASVLNLFAGNGKASPDDVKEPVVPDATTPTVIEADKVDEPPAVGGNSWILDKSEGWGTESDKPASDNDNPAAGGGTDGDKPAAGWGDDDKPTAGWGADDDTPAAGWGDDDKPTAGWGDDDKPAAGWGDDDKPAAGWGDDDKPADDPSSAWDEPDPTAVDWVAAIEVGTMDVSLSPDLEAQLNMVLEVFEGVRGTRVEILYRIMYAAQSDPNSYLPNVKALCIDVSKRPWTAAEWAALGVSYGGIDPCAMMFE
ncbi:MAG: hypothetical protein AUK47_26800 [Deltaproteobacteria bacterium CG2_30_63_29]|nr:MAG: hypothetical protein AUK47_26800 [Deltaproteobacteria bacterium CG2_30_63_29]